MKNSLKFLMVAFCALFLTAQANAVQYLDNAHSGIHMLKDNKHVFNYIPSDVKGIRGNAKRAIHNCDESGVEVEEYNRRTGESRSRKTAGTCATYHSPSARTSWIILFVRNPGTSIRAQKIFELRNDQRKLWATFDPSKYDKNIYASSGARKFANTKGVSDTDLAKNEDSKSPDDAMNQVYKVDPADLIKKGLGTIFKGF